MTTLESVRRGLDTLQVLKAYPELVAENASLQHQVQELTGECTSLRATQYLLDGRDWSLADLEQHVRRTKEAAIHAEAQTLSDARMAGWEREKPQVVQEEAIATLHFILHGMSQPRCYYPEYLLKTGLPSQVEAVLEAEVRSRLTAEFHRRVEAEATRIAHERLDALQRDAWPRYLRDVVTPFCQTHIVDQLKALITDLPLTCDKCGVDLLYPVQPQDIAWLVKHPHLRVTCPNPTCKDLFRRHSLPITLADVVVHLVGPPARRE